MLTLVALTHPKWTDMWALTKTVVSEFVKEGKGEDCVRGVAYSAANVWNNERHRAPANELLIEIIPAITESLAHPRAPIEVVPLHLKSGPEVEPRSQVWERRKRTDPGRPYKEFRYSLAPSDKARFAVLLQVPTGYGCRIEANIAYVQWGWFPSLSRGALLTSGVSFPDAGDPQKSDL